MIRYSYDCLYEKIFIRRPATVGYYDFLLGFLSHGRRDLCSLLLDGQSSLHSLEHQIVSISATSGKRQATREEQRSRIFATSDGSSTRDDGIKRAKGSVVVYNTRKASLTLSRRMPCVTDKKDSLASLSNHSSRRLSSLNMRSR
jgi:hypothetical protein